MNFVDTRTGKNLNITWKQAILRGKISEGLIVFDKLNRSFSSDEIDEIVELDFADMATEVISHFFFADENDKNLINKLCREAYSDKNWDHEDIVPIVKCGDNYHAEQWYGKTAAFKDIAMSFFAPAIREALKEENKKRKKELKKSLQLLIFGATSGDTGSAAEGACQDVKNVYVAILYPENGKVTYVQKVQLDDLQTTDGKVSVYSVLGNFDFCQNDLVKPILDDDNFKNELEEKYNFKITTPNSINIGRIAPQIVTAFQAYKKIGEIFNVCIPSGNFGHALSAWYAKQLGLPIDKIIIASNENDVLAKFFQMGIYEPGEFKTTNSPSMDIKVSSNLERLLFHIAGAEKTKQWMNDFNQNERFEVDAETLKKLQEDFDSGMVSEKETLKEIRDVWKKNNRLLDPHTAVASCVATRFQTSDSRRQILVYETAHWGKFIQTIFEALELEGGQNEAGEWEIEGMQVIEKIIVNKDVAPKLTGYLSRLTFTDKKPRKSGVKPSVAEMKRYLVEQIKS